MQLRILRVKDKGEGIFLPMNSWIDSYIQIEVIESQRTCRWKYLRNDVTVSSAPLMWRDNSSMLEQWESYKLCKILMGNIKGYLNLREILEFNYCRSNSLYLKRIRKVHFTIVDLNKMQVKVCDGATKMSENLPVVVKFTGNSMSFI